MEIVINEKKPIVGENVYLAPTATLIGEVKIGANSSIWFNAVLRGDVAPITIGEQTNLQDGVMVHGTYKKAQVDIGDQVTVGHGAILHGCQIGKGTLIGMGAILMDGVRIGEKSLVAAGALVTENSRFEPGVLIIGRPARAIRSLTNEEMDQLQSSTDNYLLYKQWYL